MDEVKETMKMAYAEYPGWKEDSDKLFGPKEALEVWAGIGSFLPAPGADLVVVGVSENIPTHLVSIWKTAISERQGKVKFLVGDLGRFPVENLMSQEVKPNSDDRCSFNIFQWDAENLPINSSSVDVIFDRAGWLWHCIKEYKDESRLMDSLTRYHQLLKNNGVVVIDAIEGFDDYINSLSVQDRADFRTKMRDGQFIKPSNLLENPPGQYQPSTVDVITNNTSNDFWFYVSRMFDIEDVGVGVTRVRVLKKKTN